MKKINSAIIELQSHCGYKCWQVYKTSGYWSPHGGPQGYGGLQPYEKCGTDPECTDTMESGLSHLKTLQKEHWLTAKNMPIYLKYYDQVIFSFWERVLLTGLAAFVLIYLYFYFKARILRRVMLRKEVIIRRCSDRVNAILMNLGKPYANLPLVTEPTAKNIRVAVERVKLNASDSKLVDEAMEILEDRERNEKNFTQGA